MSETNVATLPVVQPPAAPRREVRVVNDLIPVLDTAKFEHMQRVANVMAFSSLTPLALTHYTEGDGLNRQWIALDERTVQSNCFLVVNQASRWGMDPFAVAQCVSVVHGKLCYEGKLIAAVISAKLGYDLEYEFSGEDDKMQVVVSAALDGKPIVDSKNRPKVVEGTVAEWQTTGNGSPWKAPGGKKRMLRYRGAREWCRVYAPALMLGVYSDDELEILSDNDRRGHGARDVTPEVIDRPAIAAPPRKAPPPPEGPDQQETQSQPTEASPSVAPADQAKPAEAESAKPVASNPPRKAPPPPPEEAQPSASTNEWPNPDEEPSLFLIKVEARLLECKDGEEAAQVFADEIQNRAGKHYEQTMVVFERLQREKFGAP